MHVIGVDIGGTSLRIGLVDEKNGLSAFEKLPQKSVLKENPLSDLARYIGAYITRHNADGTIAAICIGLPATIDRDRAVVLNAPNVDGFNGVNVKSYLQGQFEFPVFLEKDVNALLYYDLYRYGIENTGVIMACYVGTGLGNAISIDGRILTGSNGAAGELGHIPVWGSEEICNCGNPGCVETLVGGKHLDALQREEFPDTAIERLFAEKAGHPRLEGYVRHLALPIATEINILDPETVILGGGVLSMPGFPKGKLEEFIRRHARKPLPEAALKFVYSENGGENGVVGAGIAAWDRIGKGR